MKQSYIESSSSEEELSEQSLFEPSIKKETKSKRGRKPEEPKWTRVVKYQPNIALESQSFSIVKDLNKLFEDSDEES
jgi:DNA polymerase II small subunit/DNA polymerase delta subunit B